MDGIITNRQGQVLVSWEIPQSDGHTASDLIRGLRSRGFDKVRYIGELTVGDDENGPDEDLLVVKLNTRKGIKDLVFQEHGEKPEHQIRYTRGRLPVEAELAKTNVNIAAVEMAWPQLITEDPRE